MILKGLKIGVWQGALSLVLAISLALSLASCTKEQMPRGEGNNDYNEFSLELTPPGAFTTPSRAMSATDQNAINRVEVFVFKQGNLLDHSKATVTSNNGQSATVKMTLPLSQTESDMLDIMVIANAPTDFDYESYKIKTKQELKDALNFSIDDTKPRTEFMMYGEALNTLISSKTRQLKIQMLRSLARVDIGVGKYNSITDTWAGLEDVFKLSEVRLVNRRDKFALIPSSTLLNKEGKVTVATPTIPKNVGVIGTTADDALKYTDIIDEKYIKSTIFLAEAPKEENRVTVLVGGSYRGAPTSYYRIDIRLPDASLQADGYLDILRNHLYRISIISVEKTGYATPQLALDNVPINISVVLTPIEEGGWGDVVFDKNNHIMTDVSNLLLYCEPDGVKSYDIFSVKVLSSSGDVGTVEGPGITGKRTLTQGDANKITLTLPKGIKTGSYTITLGRMTKTIPINVQPAMDAHFDFLPFMNVASMSVENQLPWLTLSQNITYVAKEQQSTHIEGNKSGKAYIHFDENIAHGESDLPRIGRVLMRRNNAIGTTGVVVEQLNLKGMLIGMFGGERDVQNGGQSQQLAIEAIEEFSERVYDDTSIGTPISNLPFGMANHTSGGSFLITPWSGKVPTYYLMGDVDYSGITPPFTIFNNFAAKYCCDKNRGSGISGEITSINDIKWYLPAQNQMMAVWIAKEALKVKPLSDVYYWSASEKDTQDTWYTSIKNGHSTFVGKANNRYNIRCVRDI